jgi:hypothetical protein
MTGRVNDGDQVTVTPLGTRDPDVGDVVLVRCRGHEYLHLVKARQGDRFLIGNNRGGLNGWVGRRAIFGVATQIELVRARLATIKPRVPVVSASHGGKPGRLRLREDGGREAGVTARMAAHPDGFPWFEEP